MCVNITGGGKLFSEGEYEKLLAEKDLEFAIKNADYLRSRREINFMKPFFLEKLSEHYSQVVQNLRQKAVGRKIRVGFFVMYESIFPAQALFEAMGRDPNFEVQIILVNLYTDYYGYSREDIIKNYNSAYEELSKKYDNILKTYDPETESYLDIADKFDILCFESTYMHLNHPYYLIDHFLHHDVLSIYVNYGYFVSKHILSTVATAVYSAFWKVFIDSFIFLEELKEHEDVKGANAVVSGYVRMDDLASFKPKERVRKRIIIAPHHAGMPNAKDREDANFFRFADFFLDLPAKYPHVDFIFRPHPFAVDSFSQHKDWSRERVEEYINRLKSYPNVIYSGGGEHLELFADSDGIIHDCGSFLCEYLFTGKPACYMLREKDRNNLDKYFNKLGLACLDNCYKAFSEEDMTDFIENVVVGGKDPMKNERVKFEEEHLKINYPFATKVALDNIKSELGIDD